MLLQREFDKNERNMNCGDEIRSRYIIEKIHLPFFVDLVGAAVDGWARSKEL